jgi:hypothetical protein
MAAPIKHIFFAAVIGSGFGSALAQPAPGLVDRLSVKYEEKKMSNPQDAHAYVGMWVTEDGYIRQELLPNGRYDEARGNKRSAYQGRYKITGNHIEYWDDTGFTADGEFVNDVLHHVGMRFHRERVEQP